jgi:GTP cyclohydrolase I
MISTQNLPDVQNNFKNHKKISIQKVGVRGIKLYLPIKTKDNKIQRCLATISSYISLSSEERGANMSRFTRSIIEKLKESQDGLKDLSLFIEEISKTNNFPESVYIKAKFEYILDKFSPMSHLYSPEPISVIFESVGGKRENQYIVKNYLTIKAIEISACSCSYEMSKLANNMSIKEKQEIENLSNTLKEKINIATLGVHNQRSEVEIKIELNSLNEERYWIEDLVEVAEKSASSPSYNVVLRNDEKYLSEVMVSGSYCNDNFEIIKTEWHGNAFSEDIGRNVSFFLEKELDKKILDYLIIINNLETIHTTLTATSILNAGRNLK